VKNKLKIRFQETTFEKALVGDAPMSEKRYIIYGRKDQRMIGCSIESEFDESR